MVGDGPRRRQPHRRRLPPLPAALPRPPPADAGRFLHTGGAPAPAVAAIGAAGRSAPGQEEAGELAFLKVADKLMGDLGTSGDAPFGGEVALDPESQAGAGCWRGLWVLSGVGCWTGV